MVDLYPTLLRDVKMHEYGATLSGIASLGQRGKEMETRKLIVIVDGDKYDPIECDSINISFENGTIKVDVLTATKVAPTTEEAPAEKGFTVAEYTDKFSLSGPDLMAFESLSKFRDDSNKSTETAGKFISIETEKYNIQDMNSVQAAILDLVEKESNQLTEGQKVVSVNFVEFKYVDDDNFILIETAILSDPEEVPEK